MKRTQVRKHLASMVLAGGATIVAAAWLPARAEGIADERGAQPAPATQNDAPNPAGPPNAAAEPKTRAAIESELREAQAAGQYTTRDNDPRLYPPQASSGAYKSRGEVRSELDAARSDGSQRDEVHAYPND